MNSFPVSWREVLQEEWEKPYFLALMQFLENEYAEKTHSTFPKKDQIFQAFSHTPFAHVKVVIIGQDPYHGPGQAEGLSFSVPQGMKLPPSLKNIFKELQSDLKIPPSPHGHLLYWAQQGVLLLNATLTVNQGSPLSHQGRGWEIFTDRVLKLLFEKTSPIVFVLWGQSAQAKGDFLCDSCSPHLVLKAPHPSPFSAHRGFFGSAPFSTINAFLEKNGQTPIDWTLPH